jgi:hypothetical protein
LERAGEIYGFHPLMLKQLSTAIKRTRERDIESAFRLKLIDQAAPQKILQKSFDLLNKDEQRVACTVSALRSAFSFESAQALLSNMKDDGLWHILQELRSLGFLLYDDKTNQFDFHPIMRSFLYDSLTAKDKVHQQAVGYFEAMPKVEKVVTLDDLAPVIELYHHLIGAGKFDEARALFRDRLHTQLYYQLSSYSLYSELLKELFPNGENQPPRLKQEGCQAWTLNSLANSYSMSGQPAKAVPLFFGQMRIREKEGSKKNLAIGLGNVANVKQIPIGQLSAAAMHLRKAISLDMELKSEYDEAADRKELGRVLAYQGRFELSDRISSAEDQFQKAYQIDNKQNNYQALSLISADRSLSALLQVRVGQVGNLSYIGQIANLPYIEAQQALEYCNLNARSMPNQSDFIQAYWLLGESLIQMKKQDAKSKIKPLEIHFYDEPFQTITGTEAVQSGNELTVAEHCLTEALRRCRRVNLVMFEADILLAFARLEWANRCDALDKCVASIEATLKEAKEIAERAGYRLQLADIHLFCGEVLLENPGGKLLGATTKEHLQLAKEYAKDVSKLEDLYHSTDKHFYDAPNLREVGNLPQVYEMLKRGMTEQERIENGYYVAYQIAEALEKKLK